MVDRVRTAALRIETAGVETTVHRAETAGTEVMAVQESRELQEAAVSLQDALPRQESLSRMWTQEADVHIMRITQERQV